MSAKLQIHPRVRRLILYIEDIEEGLIQIPAFQRDFIWKNNDKLDLFDSLKRGFPIGSILFWNPKEEEFASGPKIGPYSIPSRTKDYFYVLDGFQRLSTLFGCLTNPDKTSLQFDRNEWEKEYRICYDLDAEEFFIPRSDLEPFQVNIYNLIDTRFTFSFQRDLVNAGYNEQKVERYLDRYERLGTTLIDFQLPSIDIIGGGIEDAVEIFSRVNSKGAEMSTDWMVSALTYNRDQDFRLGTLIDDLLEELRLYNFHEIKREVILQCIINSFGKVYFDQKKIEQLVRRDDFILTTRTTIDSIKKAVKFLFEELLVIDGKLLPYNIQLIFVTAFFNAIDKPNEKQIRELKKWFWVTTYPSYFTIYSLSKRRKAYDTFQKFLGGETDSLIYNDKPETPFSVTDFPNKIYFGSVRAKALVLFLLNFSNDFKSVLSKDVEGLNVSYLYYDMKKDGFFYPEIVVPMIDFFQPNFPKTKDMSFLLDDYKEDYRKYLLTEEMSSLHKAGKREEVRKKRMSHIIKQEEAFVRTLGVDYLVIDWNDQL